MGGGQGQCHLVPTRSRTRGYQAPAPARAVSLPARGARPSHAWPSCREGVGQGRRDTGVCSERVPSKPARLPACPPNRSHLVHWLRKLPQQGSEEQKLPPGGPQADGQTDRPRDRRLAARPKKGEDQIGKEAGLGGRDGLTIPRGPRAVGQTSGRSRGHRGSLEKPQGSPKEGNECSARPKGGQKTREEINKRRDEEEVGFRLGLANVYCVFTGPGSVLSPGEPETNDMRRLPSRS